MKPIFPLNQESSRNQIYAAHSKRIDQYWDDQGNFIWGGPGGNQHGGFRGIMWQCFAYLNGDKKCVGKANKIIERNYSQKPCHFAPGAVIDLLHHYSDKLTPDVKKLLENYLRLNLPFMSTEDLKIHGYNDNHVYKGIHVLLVGGEMLGMPNYVETGLKKLRQAVEVFQRNGFPCEYNSPGYAPVSLQPLASIVGQVKNAEAAEIALKLERFYWQDVALRFDPTAGQVTGPFSRAYVAEYEGLLSGISQLLLHLFPARFEINLVHEMYENPETSPYVAITQKEVLPFVQAHPIWYSRPDYHLTQELEDTIFRKKTGGLVRGTSESGTGAVVWKDPSIKPEGAPDIHRFGPRQTLVTTYYGEGYSLGTSRYAWLDNAQAHGFYATISSGITKDGKVPAPSAQAYFSRFIFNEEYPYREIPQPVSNFADRGEIRTIQSKNTAVVFYNPYPHTKRIQRMRVGLFRPLYFSKPKEVFVGDIAVPHLNLTHEKLLPVAINEGNVYVGIIPLLLNNGSQSRKAVLQLHTYSKHLSILFSSFEDWGPKDLSYSEIVETNTGFVFEIHPASEFKSFEDFRKWLAQAKVNDDYYAVMRTTTYEREGLKLSSSYSPYQSAFRFTSVNNTPYEVPTYDVSGIPDPGYGFVKKS